MPLTIATWNINSVRLRIDLVQRYLAEAGPDVLCLQETKCPDAEFPKGALAAAGYGHMVYRGMKGYNGVAILSRRPLREADRMSFCGKEDARHIAAEVEDDKGRAIIVHNFYIPAGGDVPDRDENPKFGHKLDFLDELSDWSSRSRKKNDRWIVVGDLNIAPLVSDVWNHKALLTVVSHTPVETDALNSIRKSGDWTDAVRCLKPEPEPVFSWWSYRAADWSAADKGRRLDHVWVGNGLSSRIASAHLLREARGWDRPSDHIPVSVTLSD